MSAFVTFTGTNWDLGQQNAMNAELYTLFNVLAPSGGILVSSYQLNLSMNAPALLLSETAAGQGANIYMRNGTTVRWQFGMDNNAESGSNVGANFFINRFSDAGSYIDTPLQIARGNGVLVTNSLVIGTALTPSVDNGITLGSSSKRWSVVYAGTGTINTSDARDKAPVAAMSAAEIEAAKLLAREIGTFQYLDALASKGPAARMHVGMTVQRVMEIMRAQGLDPLRYGFICHDSWGAEQVPAAIEPRASDVLDANGTPIVQQVVVRPAYTVPAGDRYGFRTDELLLFIARGFEARLAALEAALP